MEIKLEKIEDAGFHSGKRWGNNWNDSSRTAGQSDYLKWSRQMESSTKLEQQTTVFCIGGTID